ncbi:hemerythrin domain-containing protein [Thiolapillus sp.]
MTTIADLHRRRRDIVETASVIDNLLTPEQLSVNAIAKVTHILLCDLCEMVTEHLADEHKGLYPNLLTHEKSSVKNMAWGLINNDKLLKPEFSQYKRKWLKDCEFQFTDAFIDDTRGILKSLKQRMDLEETTVIPKLEKAEIFATA